MSAVVYAGRRTHAGHEVTRTARGVTKPLISPLLTKNWKPTFGWGEPTAAAYALAYALLTDALDAPEFMRDLATQFTEDVVLGLGDDWALSQESILAWASDQVTIGVVSPLFVL